MGALIPIALSLAPEIGNWLFGASGEKTASAVAQIVQSVTGTTDEAVAQQAINSNPQMAAQVRVQLAQLAAQQAQAERQTQMDALSAQLKDVSNARAQTVSLAQVGSNVQWAPAIVSLLVLSTFGVVMYAALTRALPSGSETILNMLLGTLATMATSTVAYWVGSSAGSAQKTDLLYRSTPSVGAGQ